MEKALQDYEGTSHVIFDRTPPPNSLIERTGPRFQRLCIYRCVPTFLLVFNNDALQLASDLDSLPTIYKIVRNFERK